MLKIFGLLVLTGVSHGFFMKRSKFQCDWACPKNYAPVCASDEITYGNFCLFRKAVCRNPDLKKASNGRCVETYINLSVTGDYKELAVPPMVRATGPSKSMAYEHSSLAGQKKKLVKSVTPRPFIAKHEEQAPAVDTSLIKSLNGIRNCLPGLQGCH